MSASCRRRRNEAQAPGGGPHCRPQSPGPTHLCGSSGTSAMQNLEGKPRVSYRHTFAPALSPPPLGQSHQASQPGVCVSCKGLPVRPGSPASPPPHLPCTSAQNLPHPVLTCPSPTAPLPHSCVRGSLTLEAGGELQQLILPAGEGEVGAEEESWGGEGQGGEEWLQGFGGFEGHSPPASWREGGPSLSGTGTRRSEEEVRFWPGLSQVGAPEPSSSLPVGAVTPLGPGQGAHSYLVGAMP